jgi:aminopeptidase
VDEGASILAPDELRRYADAIVKASLGVGKGDYVLVQGHPAHREVVVGIAEAAYRAGATVVEPSYYDPLVERAHYEHGSRDSLGIVTPWAKRRLRELVKPHGARAVITGEVDHGYLDGTDPKRIAADQAAIAQQTKFFRKANLDLNARWTGAPWPTGYWASQVYPDLAPPAGKRRLAEDFLWFCRLTDEDGKGARGWLEHVRAIARRSAKLTRLDLAALELRGPGTELDVKLTPGSRWLGGQEQTEAGVKIAPNMPTEESFTSPHAAGTNGTFTCTLPLTFRGRRIDGLRGEFANGRLVRLDADDDEGREFVASYVDSDPSGNGRRLGEVALVDQTSRIGQSGRTYFNTLLDENAAAHIAFGAGFGGTRPQGSRGLNRSTVHLDVMVGGPDLQVTGVTQTGRRLPVIADGLWQIS